MPNIEQYENLVLGSGVAGRLLTWTLASAGHCTAIVERGPFGGACPTVACRARTSSTPPKSPPSPGGAQSSESNSIR